MTLSRNAAAAKALHTGILIRARRLELLYLARPRLISNLLALVALFSIGFV
ncbi:MAG TPA: hypothetical protein VFA39_05350 [Steroidobacteraceae bacterium]|jgi:hypothetical protein|nr:hypothetical protein [Steroidobacteraceae bacterium]